MAMTNVYDINLNNSEVNWQFIQCKLLLTLLVVMVADGNFMTLLSFSLISDKKQEVKARCALAQRRT